MYSIFYAFINVELLKELSVVVTLMFSFFSNLSKYIRKVINQVSFEIELEFLKSLLFFITCLNL